MAKENFRERLPNFVTIYENGIRKCEPS
jgi:hypothetical protein